jgi:hypothetical protein
MGLMLRAEGGRQVLTEDEMDKRAHWWTAWQPVLAVTGIAAVCLAMLPRMCRSEVYTDSLADWSPDGVQGQGNWSYGFYDLRDDVENRDGLYQLDDFISFLNDGSQTVSRDPSFGAWKSTANDWDGSKWDLLDNLVVSHGPWTELTATGGNPAANGQGDDSVHWTIRRWESDVEGRVTLSGHFANPSPAGDGVVGRVFVDGREVLARKTDGNTAKFGSSVFLLRQSVVDFVIDPDGSGIYNPVAGSGPDAVDRISDDNDWTDFFVQISNSLVPGDADMDLQFDQLDLVKVQIADKYLTGQPATWGEGDWNGAPGGEPGTPPLGDGLFNQWDIIAALQFGAYLTGPHAAITPAGIRGDLVSVPEPSSAVLLVLAGLCFLPRLGRRHRSRVCAVACLRPLAGRFSF